MPVTLKIEYVDELVVVEQGVGAEERQGSLYVYGEDGTVAARFTMSHVRHWWAGSTKKPDDF
jgi:hypothetical protein